MPFAVNQLNRLARGSSLCADFGVTKVRTAADLPGNQLIAVILISVLMLSVGNKKCQKLMSNLV